MALADEIGLDRFTYLGHSMGGGIGMQLAIQHPERLNRLILVASIPSAGVSAGPEAHEEERQLRQTEALLMRVRDQPDERIERGLAGALSVS